jgi:type IV pilus assembly protein PilX
MLNSPAFPHKQNGSTLIIGVIMLILITLLVITAGRGITQQNIMASNTRERDVAFQAAESALRDAETRLPVFHASFAGTGLITTTTTADIATRSTAAYWTTPTTATPPGYGWYTSTGAVDTSKSLQTATIVSGVDEQPRYVVERLPNGPVDPSNPLLTIECSTDQHYRYRVTTIAVGASSGTRKSADTRVILQAEFKYCSTF